MTRRLLLTALLCAALLPDAGAQTRKKPAAPPKPALTAHQVLDRFVQETGGRAAYAKLTSTTIKGTLENPSQGMKGSFETYAKAPDKILIVQSITGIGETRQGYDGKIAWSQDPFTGLRTLEGPERELVKRSATFNGFLNWQKMYKRAEMVGVRKVDGRDTYAIRLVPATGKPVLQYHDAKTFLVVRTDTVVESPQGTLPIEAYLSDYRTVDGVRVPFKTRQRVAGIAEILLTITEVKNNVALEDTRFAKPAPKS